MILCDEDTCRFHFGDGCIRSSITICREFGGMEQGKQQVYNVCKNYEVKENGVSD